MIINISSRCLIVIQFANGRLLFRTRTIQPPQNRLNRLHSLRHRLPQKHSAPHTLLFRTHLRHKDQKIIKDFVRLKFKVDEIDEFQTQLREIDRHAKAYWKVNHSFDFYMNEHQLRKKFLVLQAYNSHKHLLGSLKMNLYSLWTGPYHLDFNLEMEKCKTSRVSFNFKISQGVHLTFQNLETEMIPKQPKFYEDCFAFTLQAITGQQLEEAASPYIVRIKANPKEERDNNNQINTVFVAKNKIIWSQQLCKEYPLPKFDKKIAYYAIYSSALHIVFFQVLPGLSDTNQLRYEMESECFISLTKLMTLEYVQFKDPVTNITYFQRTVQLLEKTWLHGEEKGKVRIKFKFIMQSHLKQMQACVRTQNGILASSPVFYQGSDTKHSCAEIQQLKKLHTDIQKEWINLQRNNRLHSNVIMIKENILRISNLLARELAVLEKSSKESLLFYEYLNQEELFSAQRFFIDLAFKVLTYIHEDNSEICDISWSILTAILKRGEFKLSQVGFSQSQKCQIQENKISDPLKLKIEVALKYQQLLNHLLKETLALLHYKGEEVERVFAEFFCSYAYFRIPLFREHILTITKRENDPQIPEWRGTQININQEDHEWKANDETDDFFGILFDWEVNFYKPIMGDQRYKLHKNELQSILLEDRWKLRLSRRSGAFFTFLENLVVQIEYVSVVSKHIKWYRMPGYNRLLYAFLVEMEQQKLKNYTERFKKTCVRLLANQKLLNIFVVILLKKTNINDAQAVDIAIDMIDSFFNSIKTNNRSIPNTFDYMYFLQGLKILLNCQVESCVSRTLLFIYHNLETFSQQFGLELAIYLLSNLFFKFFFHWSYTLRHIFHILLFTKISRYSQLKSLQNNPQKNSNESSNNTNMNLIIKDRYDSLMNIIKKQIQPFFEENNKDMFHQKVLYKKMRHNLSNKKKQQTIKQNALKSLKAIFLPDLRIKKSVSNGGVMIPHKLLYFKEEDMIIVFPKDQLRFVKSALSEYTILQDEIGRNFKEDPHFMPQIKVRKMVDEKEICPIITDEW